MAGASRGLGAGIARGLAAVGAVAEELVWAVLYLATDASSYVTGVVLRVDGGMISQ